MPPKEKLIKFKEVMKLLNEGLTRQEFVDAFKEVLKAFAKSKQEMSRIGEEAVGREIANLGDLKKRFEQAITDAEQANTTTFEGVRKRAVEGISALFDKMRLQQRFDTLTAEYEGKIATLDAKIRAVPDASTLIQEALSLIPVQVQHVDTPEEERDRLETLKGEERLDKSAIKGLDEDLATLRSRTERVQTPAKVYRTRTADCSAQCDGATKTFSVGGTHFGIIGVYSTEFPIIYRPLIDYTETVTGFTLTASVSAPASGQTLTAQFLK